VLIKVKHEVVGDDGVARGEEGNEPSDQVDLSGRETLFQVNEVGLEVDFFDSPCVLDAIAEHVIEHWVTHGAQGEAEAGIEDMLRRGDGGGYSVCGDSRTLFRG
jgi:hypothetical protein